MDKIKFEVAGLLRTSAFWVLNKLDFLRNDSWVEKGSQSIGDELQNDNKVSDQVDPKGKVRRLENDDCSPKHGHHCVSAKEKRPCFSKMAQDVGLGGVITQKRCLRKNTMRTQSEKGLFVFVEAKCIGVPPVSGFMRLDGLLFG